MRLIDADAFGNRMYHEVFEKDSDDQRWDSGCWMRYKLFEKVLKEQPTVEQLEQQWIPCSERLPEYGGWYITTYRITKDNNNRVGLLWYSTLHGWEWDNAIAWMPLPKPYREDDHDNT